MKWRWSFGGWVVATIVSYILLTTMEVLVHGALLVSRYAELGSHWLPEPVMRSRAWLMWIGYLIFAMLFPYIYTRGYRGGSGPAEGLLYGLWIGLLIFLPRTLLNLSTLSIDGVIMGTWGVAGLIESMIVGVVVGSIYRPKEVAEADG